MEQKFSHKKVRNGQGIVAEEKILAGEVLFEIEGEVMPIKAAKALPDQERNNTIRFSETEYLSPKNRLGDKFNHSCNPNCRVFKKNGKLFAGAIREIKPDEEITFDYSTVLADDDIWEMRCNCGETTCRKKIRQFRSLPEKLKEKYRRLQAVPDYIDSRNKGR